MLAAIMRRIFETVQQVLVPVFLVLVYVIGFGITALYVWIFHRRLVAAPGKDSETYWVKAVGYEPNEKEFSEQS